MNGGKKELWEFNFEEMTCGKAYKNVYQKAKNLSNITT